MRNNPFLIRAVAWAVRRGRAARRRVFQRATTPAWLKDVVSAIEPLQRLNLIPTAIAIATTPNHFFRLTPALVEKKRRVYASPLQFFIGMLIVLAALGFSWVYVIPVVLLTESSAPQWPHFLILLGVAVLAPLWIVLFAALFLIFPPTYAIIDATGKRPQFLLPLDYQMYQRLDPKRYMWNVFYFAAFFVLTFPFVAGLIAVTFQLESVWAIFRVFWIATYATFLVAPYAAVLRASVIVPSPNMIAADVAPLAELLSRPAATVNRDAATWESYCADLSRLHRALARCETSIRRRAASSSALANQYDADLGAAYAAMPLHNLQWLTAWGRGTVEERDTLAAALFFVVSHETSGTPSAINVFARPISTAVVLGVLLVLALTCVIGLYYVIK